MSGKSKRSTKTKTKAKTPTRAKTPKRQTQPRTQRPTRPGGKGFGVPATEAENHVHVPPELLNPDQDILGNDFIQTMLA